MPSSRRGKRVIVLADRVPKRANRLFGLMSTLLLASVIALVLSTQALSQRAAAPPTVDMIGAFQGETSPPRQKGPNFGGFGTPFSPLGAPRNVIVLRRDYNDGRTFYSVRVFYENDSDVVVAGGVSQVFQYIGRYGSVTIDAAGNITRLSTFVVGMNDPAFRDYAIQSIIYDPLTLSEIETTYSGQVSLLCIGEGQIEHCRRDELSQDALDEATSNTYMYTRTHNLTTNYSVNGFNFPEVQLTILTLTTGSILGEVRARGIGQIEALNSLREPSRRVIYYQVNGSTGGSLSGTPFEAGQPLDGFYF